MAADVEIQQEIVEGSLEVVARIHKRIAGILNESSNSRKVKKGIQLSIGQPMAKCNQTNVYWILKMQRPKRISLGISFSRLISSHFKRFQAMRAAGGWRARRPNWIRGRKNIRRPQTAARNIHLKWNTSSFCLLWSLSPTRDECRSG